MTHRIYKKRLLIGTALITSLAPVAGSDARAQDDKKSPTIEEIVVTATKRESNIQETPIAITALSDQALLDSGANNIEDLTGLSPSFSATNINGQFVATIRGVGNELITTGVAEAGVAFHTNGVYNASLVPSSLAFFDVERVEILRGPQGTLWGRNSTGGAVNVIQARPTEEFEGYAQVSYGRFDSIDAQGAISGPITDNVQGRIAASYSYSDGFLEDLSGNGNLGDDDSINIRGSLNIDLGENASWLIAGGYGRQDFRGLPTKQGGTAFAPGQINPLTALVGQPTDGSLSLAEQNFGLATPQGEFTTFATNPDARYELDAHYVTSEFTYSFDGFDLTLLTDYRGHDRDWLTDIDFTPQSEIEESVLYVEDNEEFSQEVRFTSTDSGPFQWLLGLYYFNQTVENDIRVAAGPYFNSPDIFVGPLTGGLLALPFLPQVVNTQGGVLEVNSYAVFGQASYDFTDKLSMTFGLRYSYDEKESDERLGIAFDPTGTGNVVPFIQCPGAGCPFPSQFEDDWDDVTGRIGFDYQINDNVLLFANFSRGYKAGGINLGAGTGGFDEETVWTGETGVKATTLDGRLQANITGFYSDFSGFQLQSVDNATTLIVNADAEIYGLEAEVRLLPTRTSRVGIVGSWNDSEITDYGGPGGITVNPSTLAVVQPGQPLPRTPEFSFRIDAQQDVDLSENLRMTLGAAFRWQSDINLDSFGTFNAEQDSYGVLDAFIRLAGDDDSSWSIDVYGRNLTNEFYRTSAFAFSAALGSTFQTNIGMPRSWGIMLRTEF